MIISSINEGRLRSTRTISRKLKRTGQLLVVSSIFSLFLIGPLQPNIAAIRSSDGFHIVDSNYQFTTQEMGNGKKTLEHTFTLYNGRSHPIEVEASADCGCTGLSWQRATINPFGHQKIVATMNNSNRSSTVGLIFKLGKGQYAYASLKQEKHS